jgi:hypothetical protein
LSYTLHLRGESIIGEKREREKERKREREKEREKEVIDEEKKKMEKQ